MIFKRLYQIRSASRIVSVLSDYLPQKRIRIELFISSDENISLICIISNSHLMSIKIITTNNDGHHDLLHGLRKIEQEN